MSNYNLRYFLSQLFSPSYRYEVSTAMSKKTILRTVDADIGSCFSGCRFHGKVTENGFRIRPHIKGSNTIAPPQIDATVIEEDGRSVIKYHVHVPIYYMIGCVFLSSALIFLALFSLFTLPRAIVSGDLTELINSMGSLVVVAIFETVIQLSFRIPVKKARKKLDDMLIL